MSDTSHYIKLLANIKQGLSCLNKVGIHNKNLMSDTSHYIKLLANIKQGLSCLNKVGIHNKNLMSHKPLHQTPSKHQTRTKLSEQGRHTQQKPYE